MHYSIHTQSHKQQLREISRPSVAPMEMIPAEKRASEEWSGPARALSRQIRAISLLLVVIVALAILGLLASLLDLSWVQQAKGVGSVLFSLWHHLSLSLPGLDVEAILIS